MVSKNIERLVKDIKESSLCGYCKKFDQGIWNEIAKHTEEVGEERDKPIFLVHNENFDLGIIRCGKIMYLGVGHLSGGYEEINFISDGLCEVYVCSKFLPLENVSSNIKEKIFMNALEKSSILQGEVNIDIEYELSRFEKYLGKESWRKIIEARAKNLEK